MLCTNRGCISREIKISLVREIKIQYHKRTYSAASLSSTCLFFSRSTLFPAIAIIISFPTIFLNSLTHFLTLTNDSASVISYTNNAPSIL